MKSQVRPSDIFVFLFSACVCMAKHKHTHTHTHTHQIETKTRERERERHIDGCNDVRVELDTTISSHHHLKRHMQYPSPLHIMVYFILNCLILYYTSFKTAAGLAIHCNTQLAGCVSEMYI